MQIEKNTKQIGIYLYFQDTAYLRTWFKVSISLNHPNLMLSVYGLMVFIRLINHVKRLVMESGSQHEAEVLKAIDLVVRLLKTIRFREDATLTHTVDTDAQLFDRGDHQSGFIGEVEQFFGGTVKNKRGGFSG